MRLRLMIPLTLLMMLVSGCVSIKTGNIDLSLVKADGRGLITVDSNRDNKTTDIDYEGQSCESDISKILKEIR